MVRDALKLKITITRFWTGSLITLAWIKLSPHRGKIFVANRAAQIQEMTNGEDWFYVPTKENPADVVSREQLSNIFLENEMWKKGPSKNLKSIFILEKIIKIIQKQRNSIQWWRMNY